MCISSFVTPLAVANSDVPGAVSNKSANLQNLFICESSAKSAINPPPAGSSNCLIVIVSALVSVETISYFCPSCPVAKVVAPDVV